MTPKESPLLRALSFRGNIIILLMATNKAPGRCDLTVALCVTVGVDPGEDDFLGAFLSLVQ